VHGLKRGLFIQAGSEVVSEEHLAQFDHIVGEWWIKGAGAAVTGKGAAVACRAPLDKLDASVLVMGVILAWGAG
jgi:hypothetical protein